MLFHLDAWQSTGRTQIFRNPFCLGFFLIFLCFYTPPLPNKKKRTQTLAKEEEEEEERTLLLHNASQGKFPGSAPVAIPGKRLVQKSGSRDLFQNESINSPVAVSRDSVAIHPANLVFNAGTGADGIG